jgi:hypothetical protein
MSLVLSTPVPGKLPQGPMSELTDTPESARSRPFWLRSAPVEVSITASQSAQVAAGSASSATSPALPM